MVANIASAILNVPLAYLLIFGGFGIPSLGIFGAGVATSIAWLFGAGVLARLVFTWQNDADYGVRREWRFEPKMFRRLLRFGLPSGFNLFLEMAGFAWFVLEMGAFGTAALAASNIAFSINSLVFMPTLGLNMAVSVMVGQAMGRRKPQEAERVAWHTLHLAAAYMLPVSLGIALFAPELVDLFTPTGMTSESFAPVRDIGIPLLYFIAVYSLIDSANIIYFGALKGAGDTLGVLLLMGGALIFLLICPIAILKLLGVATVFNLWVVFTAYVILLAVGVLWRFYRRGWHSIRVVETPPAL